MAADRRTPGPGHRPFEGLARAWRPTPAPIVPAPVAPAADRSPADPAVPDDDLFARAMSDVVPLAPPDRERIGEQPPAESLGREILNGEAAALATLSEFVSGEVRFEVSDTVEYLEGAVVGLDSRLVRRLRRGEFARQALLDLHGMAAGPARAAVEDFLRRAVRAGHRCVLIVHGRGRNSKDGEPVLKRGLVSWLSHGAIGRSVLAFCSARPQDGGAGAMYVLLRRDRRKQPVRPTRGSMSE